MKRRGFTLIELLVVVAIIAILAAIAVPNFLEAMVRSKVSRVKADLRSLSTAIETYRIDSKGYPPDLSSHVLTYLERLRYLTTPIAYMTSIPPDPFADRGSIIEYTSTRPSNPYTIDGKHTSPFAHTLTYDYACRRRPNGSWESWNAWALISSNPASTQWAMRSCAPDKWPSWLGEKMASYDPTNGTVSEGNIYWSGPGIGLDQPRIQ